MESKILKIEEAEDCIEEVLRLVEKKIATEEYIAIRDEYSQSCIVDNKLETEASRRDKILLWEKWKEAKKNLCDMCPPGTYDFGETVLVVHIHGCTGERELGIYTRESYKKYLWYLKNKYQEDRNKRN